MAIQHSNRKSLARREAPTEPFKRAVTGCLRAIARKPDLEVTFAAERPGLVGGKARLPEPPRKLTRAEAAIVRGHADAIALRLACHDAGVHRKLQPGGQQARAVFEAVEQARVEAIGARRMNGVAKQSRRHARRALPARQVRRSHRPRRRADRGGAGPDRARAADRLSAAGARQEAGRSVAPADRGPRRARSRPARAWSRTRRASATRCTTCSTRSTWATTAAADREDEADDGEEDQRKQQSGEDGDGAESEDTQRMSMEDARSLRRGHARQRRRGGRGADRRHGRRRRHGRFRDAGRAAAAAPPRQERAARSGLPPLHHAVRRDGRGRGPVRTRRARSAARLSRQAARASAGRGGAARQPAAAPPDGAAEPRLGVRPRGGHARYGAAAAHHHRSDASALVQAREGHELPRHGGDAAARQFRLDARAPDHGGRDVRRHPGAHAGALRRQGRDPRLHHARLEGRPVARGLARRRQAAQSRPPQRSAPHHLQVGRRAVAARAQESRPDDARGPAQGEHRRRSARLGAQPPCRRAPSSARS